MHNARDMCNMRGATVCEAAYFDAQGLQSIRCQLCPRQCVLKPGETGACHSRMNRGGVGISLNYGRISALALDPIEKKPLARFFPGSRILSVGSFGCNLKCPYCQNHSIADAVPQTQAMNSAELVDRALALKSQGNIGIAFTYNEPAVWYEYVLETARLAHEVRLKNVLVTNGFINQEPLEQLLPVIDAMNIDLKGDTQFYREVCKGSLAAVEQTIRRASCACHVELTTLLVTGYNDNLEFVERTARWIASVSADIPLHLSRFFPRYRMTETEPTDRAFVLNAVDTARKHLRHVYAGNV